jgi:hypothetical protein
MYAANSQWKGIKRLEGTYILDDRRIKLMLLWKIKKLTGHPFKRGGDFER